ncbi:MAG: DUF1127 domain-containing protein [Candidatus Sedimenticola sp. 20ELBAFRAG]
MKPQNRVHSLIRAFAQLLGCWSNRYRQRQLLRQLEDHILKDIGLSRVDAEAEAMKPFWRK